jgi:hypothetical protein
MWDKLNRGISTPIAIIVIVIFALTVGAIDYLQYKEIQNIKDQFAELKFPEKKNYFSTTTCSSSPDCICCDSLLLNGEPVESNICVNEEYISSNNFECLQIDSIDSFCAMNGCQCDEKECVSMSLMNINFEEEGNLAKDIPGLGEGWFLVYEKPGAPGLSVKLVFNKETECDYLGENNCAPFVSGELIGQRISVSGMEEEGFVLIKEINLLAR